MVAHPQDTLDQAIFLEHAGEGHHDLHAHGD